VFAQKPAREGVIAMDEAGRLRWGAWTIAVLSVACFATTPAETSVAVGIVSLCWSAVLATASGLLRHDSFRLWQPFRGGIVFVLLQALGWTFFAVNLGLCILVALNRGSFARFAPGIGVFGFAANALLILSIDKFDARKAQAPESQGKDELSSSVGKFVLIAAATTMVGVSMTEFASGSVKEEAIKIGQVVNVILAVFVHGFCGSVQMAEKGYSLIQPFGGGWAFQLLQAIAWLLFGVNFFVFKNRHFLRLNHIRGGTFLFASSCFSTSVLLLRSLRFFKMETTKQRRIKWRSFSSISFVYVVSIILALVPALDIATDAALGSQTIKLACGVLATPTAHVGGYLMIKDYSLYKPLFGGPSFVLTQAIGWLLYASFLYVAVFSKSGPGVFQPVAMFSHAVILASVHLFQDDSTEKKKIPEDEDDESIEESEVGKFFPWIADLLAVIGLLVNIAVDVIVSFDLPPVEKAFLDLSLPIWIFARFGLYWDIFEGRVMSWRPFSGPDVWILSEAVSWTLFVVSCLSSLILLVAAHSSDSRTNFGWTTAVGLGHVFAHLLLRTGASELWELQRSTSRRTGRLRRSSSISASAANPVEPSWREKYGILYAGVFALVDTFMFAFCDFRMKKASILQASFFTAVLGVIGMHVLVAPKLAPKYKLFQPFRGGALFVLIQSIAWSLFGVCCVVSLVSINASALQSAHMPGLFTSVGAGFSTVMLLLLWSIQRYEPQSTEAIQIDGRIGFVLGLFALALFLLADFAVIRFALPFSFFRPVVASAWVASCASVPLSIFVSFKAPGKSFADVSPTLLVVGCGLWTFTVLLGAMLVANSILNSDYLPSAWSATLAGASNLVSHVLLKISKSDNFAEFIPAALVTSFGLYVSVRAFAYLVLPLIRGFLDHPMYIYAILAKRWEGWVSPDGLQALSNVHVQRTIRYGTHRRHYFDLLRPLHISKCHVKEKFAKRPPVVYLHGGGHICVGSELLLHSMTPIARAGLTVYCVEYPLSPEEPYPSAVLSVILALLWIRDFHCSNPMCTALCSVKSGLDSHECHVSSCKAQIWDFKSIDPSKRLDVPHKCPTCGEALGTDSVQLLGDSAGGSLVASITSLIKNPSLLETTLQLDAAKAYRSALFNLNVEALPEIVRLGILYGLLGRQTPMNCSIDEGDGGVEGTWSNYAFKWVSHVGISFMLHLYGIGFKDPTEMTKDPVHCTLNDLPKEELQNFAAETLIICGESDPLLLSNIEANRRLTELGHACELHLVPGTHAFHGFPVNWLHLMGADWHSNAFAATVMLLSFFTGGNLDEPALQEKKRRQVMLPDYSPLIVFPLCLIVFPSLTIFWLMQLLR